MVDTKPLVFYGQDYKIQYNEYVMTGGISSVDSIIGLSLISGTESILSFIEEMDIQDEVPDKILRWLKVDKYEASSYSDICPYAYANIHIDHAPDNFTSFFMGKAVDVAHLINPDCIHSAEGNSDDWFLYVNRNVSLFKEIK